MEIINHLFDVKIIIVYRSEFLDIVTVNYVVHVLHNIVSRLCTLWLFWAL